MSNRTNRLKQAVPKRQDISEKNIMFKDRWPSLPQK